MIEKPLQLLYCLNVVTSNISAYFTVI